MVDVVDTFLAALYVWVDHSCHSRLQEEQLPGPDASLSPSEVVTLAIFFSRWSRFGSERDFYRCATRHSHKAFPALPDGDIVKSCGLDSPVTLQPSPQFLPPALRF